MKKGYPNKYRPHHGKKECECRLKQINKGQLKKDNGLLITDESRIIVP